MARLNDFMVRADLTPFIDYCREFGRKVSYRKGESFVDEGTVCKKVALICSGYFKYATFDSAANERIIGFGFENEIITDFVRSFQFNEPAWTSIIAGSDSVVLQVSLNEVRKYFMHHQPDFIAQLSKHVLQEAYSRYLLMHTLSSAERFRAIYPRLADVINLIPNHELASFLAISRRQLQRIRGAR